MSALNVCHDSSIPVGSLIHMCVVTHSHVRMCGQLNCSVSTMCAVTHPYMCHNSSKSASLCIHERACVAYSTAHMCHNSSISASQFIHVCAGAANSTVHMCHNSSICASQFIHICAGAAHSTDICAITQPYVRHNSLTYAQARPTQQLRRARW